MRATTLSTPIEPAASPSVVRPISLTVRLSGALAALAHRVRRLAACQSRRTLLPSAGDDVMTDGFERRFMAYAIDRRAYGLWGERSA